MENIFESSCFNQWVYVRDKEKRERWALMQLTNTTDYAIRIVCYLAIKKAQGYNGKISFWIKDSGELYSQNHKAVKKREELFQLLKVSVEDMPLPKIQKRFLYLMSYHVWNQQWQSVAVLKRMDFAPETIRIAVKYIKSYWTYRTLTITD